MTGFLANVAGGIQVLADGMLAESCHGADGIPSARWKRCGAHLGHYYEPVVVKQCLETVERELGDAFASTWQNNELNACLAYLVEARLY
jgi:hypothetical protein